MGQYTLENWVSLLAEYLEEADLTIENNDIEARNVIRNKLHLFIQETPQKYEFLADIARRAIDDIDEYDLRLATDNISNIANDLNKQRALIILATNKAKESAQEIRLENFTNIIEDTSNKLGKILETSEILSDKEKSFEDKISVLKNLLKDFHE